MFSGIKKRKILKRKPLSNEEYLVQIKCVSSIEANVHRCLRSFWASYVGIDVKYLYPNDKLNEMRKLCFRDWDMVDLILHLEQELSISLSDNIEFPNPFGWRFFCWGEAKDYDIFEYSEMVHTWLIDHSYLS